MELLRMIATYVTMAASGLVILTQGIRSIHLLRQPAGTPTEEDYS
jgi:hypothetical protein